MPTRLAILLMPLAALAGCSSELETAPSDGAEAAALPDPIAPSDAMPAEEPTVAGSDLVHESLASAIPDALRGRWGLVPADCEAGRADNKGLMTVAEGTIRFYESVATLGSVQEQSATRLRAAFTYEGEGMEWSRDLVLDARAPDTLVLREFGEDAPTGPRQYRKCP